MTREQRYKVKVLSEEAFDEAERLLEQRATVVLRNRRRHTIAATGIDAETAERLRELNATVAEDVQYEID